MSEELQGLGCRPRDLRELYEPPHEFEEHELAVAGDGGVDLGNRFGDLQTAGVLVRAADNN